MLTAFLCMSDLRYAFSELPVMPLTKGGLDSKYAKTSGDPML